MKQVENPGSTHFTRVPVYCQHLMLDRGAFEQAMKRGFLLWENDRLVWTLGSSTLLAYFLGKLFCGDKAVYSKRKDAMLWSQGCHDFPSRLVKQLFGQTYLLRLRRQRKNYALPKHFLVVDSLFITE